MPGEKRNVHALLCSTFTLCRPTSTELFLALSDDGTLNVNAPVPRCAVTGVTARKPGSGWGSHSQFVEVATTAWNAPPGARTFIATGRTENAGLSQRAVRFAFTVSGANNSPAYVTEMASGYDFGSTSTTYRTVAVPSAAVRPRPTTCPSTLKISSSSTTGPLPDVSFARNVVCTPTDALM